MSRRPPTAAVILMSLAASAVPAMAVDYQRDVRPILSNHCFECHGPDAAARRADLRLDVATDLSGNLGRTLLSRITDDHADHRMPPPESGDPLSAEQVDVLERWIDAGAPWEPHWAFVAPQRSIPPNTASDWARDDIDRHLLAALEAEGLTPRAPADRATLLRRVTFDLTGLPPTPEEVHAFIGDERADAYEHVVDRLLASPRYGERMASDWLDLARFADTFGYQNDVDSNVWPYRDWVISAFNDNLSYDDFVTWQLAGDLLPDAGRPQRLATTFNRLHRQTNEGGSVEEEFRVEYVADRVHTFGTAMLGMTLECARCHDHKFDPVSQVEYYELAAFFANIDESGLYSHFTAATPTPALPLPTPAAEVETRALAERVRAAEQALRETRIAREDAFAAWLIRSKAPAIPDEIAHYPLDAIDGANVENLLAADKPGTTTEAPRPIPDGAVGGAILLDGEDSIRFPGAGAFTRTDPFTIALYLRIPARFDRAVVIHRSRSWTDAGSQGYQLLVEDGRVTWSLIHFWPGNAISIRSRKPVPVDQWTHVVISSDGSARAGGLRLYVDGEPAETDVVRDRLTRAITGGGPGPLTIGQRFRDRGFKGGAVDEVRVFGRAVTALEARHLYDGRALEDAWETAPNTLRDTYLTGHDPEVAAAREALREARAAHAAALDRTPSIMTMHELPAPRATYVLERGRYDARGEQVFAATPAVMGAFPDELPRNRLGLARWLMSPGHPLTARVAVNRLWMMVFGRGLVATAENFGSQGALPDNRALLDMLALDFIDSGWDIKAMLRRLVTTTAYRQSSGADPALHRADPENALVARGPARRLTAEMLRDHALAAGGLLVERIGGPSAFPYQPAGLWQEKSGRVYPQGTGDSLYRRSLYTFWKRTSPPPTMMIFDATKRDVCVARRQSTNTPLQALALLNDPQFVEAARALAQRCHAAADTPAEQVELAFTWLTSRPPNEQERAILVDLHAAEHAALTAAPADAAAIIAIGASPPPDETIAIDIAALTVVCSTIMNTDAAVMTR